jgi:hypothetical protein
LEEAARVTEIQSERYDGNWVTKAQQQSKRGKLIRKTAKY